MRKCSLPCKTRLQTCLTCGPTSTRPARTIRGGAVLTTSDDTGTVRVIVLYCINKTLVQYKHKYKYKYLSIIAHNCSFHARTVHARTGKYSTPCSTSSPFPRCRRRRGGRRLRGLRAFCGCLVVGCVFVFVVVVGLFWSLLDSLVPYSVVVPSKVVPVPVPGLL